MKTRSFILSADARARIVVFLVQARETAQMSQAELAAALNMGQPDISKIERLERRIDTAECLQWLDITSDRLGIDPAQTWRDLYDHIAHAGQQG